MVPHGHIWEALKVVAAAGRHRLHPCRGQRHRHVHVREADAREPRAASSTWPRCTTRCREELSFNRVIRLAENVEGAALYMVHVSAATGVAALEASRARGFPMYGETLHQYLMYNAEDYKRPGGQMYPHLPVAEVSGGPEASVGGDQPRRHPGHRHRRAVLPAARQAAGQPDRRHDRRQLRRRAAGRADVHADGDEARLFAGAFRRHDLEQRRADHGPLSAQGRAGGRLRRRHRAAADGHREDDPRRRPARDRLHAVGRATW